MYAIGFGRNQALEYMNLTCKEKELCSLLYSAVPAKQFGPGTGYQRR